MGTSNTCPAAPSIPRSEARTPTSLIGAFEHHGAGSVTEQDAGGAVREVEQMVQLLGTYEKNSPVGATADHVGADDQPVDKPGTCRVHIDRRSVPRSILF